MNGDDDDEDEDDDDGGGGGDGEEEEEEEEEESIVSKQYSTRAIDVSVAPESIAHLWATNVPMALYNNARNRQKAQKPTICTSSIGITAMTP